MLIPRELLPITKLCPKDLSRFLTNAVHCERLSGERVRMVETDGHQMLVVDYADKSADFPQGEFDASAKEGFKVLLPVKFLEDVGKTIPKKEAIPVLRNLAVNESPNGKVQVATTDLETTRKFETKVPEGTFPNYEACIPKAEREAVRIGVNAELLAKALTTVAAMLGETRSPYVTLIIENDPAKPLEILAQNHDFDAEIRAIVMPVRM